MSREDTFESLRRLVRLYLAWSLQELLGPDSLDSRERSALSRDSSLSSTADLAVLHRSFVLGVAQAVLGTGEYRDVRFSDLDYDLSDFTEEELLLVEDAVRVATTSLRALFSDIEDRVVGLFVADTSAAVTASVLHDLGRSKEESVSKSLKKVASSLKALLISEFKQRFEKIVHTQVQRAKVLGQVMAVAGRRGPYSSFGGPDALVSVVPSLDTCVDCRHHYVENGSPRVFKLKELVAGGTNQGRKHTRGDGGRHVHWVPTLPPLHPGCMCSVVALPPGASWSGMKLVVPKPGLSKAVDPTNLTPVITPPGPESSRSDTPKADAAKNPASIPGVAAPGNAPGPGRPKAAGSTGEWDYWNPEKNSGDPGEHGYVAYEKRDGTTGHRRPKGAGGRGSAQTDAEKEKAAKDWGTKPQPLAVLKDHLENGDITKLEATADLSEVDSKNVNPAFRATIDGNGRCLVKKSSNWSAEYRKTTYIDGMHTIPAGTEPKREVAAYRLFSFLGSGVCPPTFSRDIDGTQHSAQKWMEDHAQAHTFLRDNFKKSDASLLMQVPHLADQLQEVIVGDIIMGSVDRHKGNIIIAKDGSSLSAIDHGGTFSSGLSSYKNMFHRDLNSAGYKVKIPEHMQERISNTTLEDVKRELGDVLEDWSVGQTFLRMQYVQHLQDTDGHLDYDKFKSCAWYPDSLVLRAHAGNNPNAVGAAVARDKLEANKEIHDKYYKRELAHQRFEDFCMDWIDEHSANPESKFYATANELAGVGVFMGPGFAEDTFKYRASGRHREYEAQVRKSRETGLEEEMIPVADSAALNFLAKQTGRKYTDLHNEFVPKPGRPGKSEQPVVLVSKNPPQSQDAKLSVPASPAAKRKREAAQAKEVPGQSLHNVKQGIVSRFASFFKKKDTVSIPKAPGVPSDLLPVDPYADTKLNPAQMIEQAKSNLTIKIRSSED